MSLSRPLRTLSASLLAVAGSSSLLAQTQLAEFAAPQVLHNGQFGGRLALDGDHLAVGSVQADLVGTDSGAVWIFERVGTDWSFVQVLSPPGLGPGDRLGSVALSGDTLVLGAFGAGVGGEVYVYERVGGAWGLLQVLTSATAGVGGAFGADLALQGDTLVVGSQVEAYGGSTAAGVVHVFERVGGAFVHAQRLGSSAPSNAEFLGVSVAVDGDVIAAGANFGATATGRAGSVTVFERIGGAWAEAARLDSSDGEDQQNFGVSVSLRDGLLLAGARFDGPGRAGAGYLFERGPQGWAEAAKLVPAGAASHDAFGFATELGDGRALLGGESGDSVVGFERVAGQWIQTLAFGADGLPDGSRFGASLALDGGRVLVGAPAADPGCAACNSGGAYLFELSGYGFEFCQASPNSTGQGARLEALGSLAPAAGGLTLCVSGCPPNVPGMFVASSTPARIPFADGTLCLSPFAPGLVRLGDPTFTDLGGTAQHDVDPGMLAGPSLAGARWYFQHWFRDTDAGATGSNLSGGLGVTFRTQ